jgi:hypothetical protein
MDLRCRILVLTNGLNSRLFVELGRRAELQPGYALAAL